MKSLILSTSDIGGGAAVASYRLHTGLRAVGRESQMLVREKLSSDPDVTVWDQPRDPQTAWLDQLTSDLRLKARTPLSTTYFSLPWPGEPIINSPAVTSADVINLHWVGHFVSPEGLRQLLSLGKPVLLTLHDQRAFTGGCHYSSGCSEFMRECVACPQLRPEFHPVPQAALAHSVALAAGTAPPVVVAPSQWLACEARRSRLFKDCRVEVIPYGLDLDVFQRGDTASARAWFGLPQDALVIVFGAQSLAEPRKGFDLVQSAIEHLLTEPTIAALVRDRRLILAAYGQSGDQLRQTRLPLVLLGEQASEQDMARVLSASDLFVCPSREDNLPNTVMEAMACGVPVLGADVGGIPDMITDGQHGRLVPADDALALAKSLRELIIQRSTWQHYGQQARAKCEQHYALAQQGQAYAALHDELLKQPKSTTWKPVGTVSVDAATAALRDAAKQAAATLVTPAPPPPLNSKPPSPAAPRDVKTELKRVEEELTRLRKNPLSFLFPTVRRLKRQRNRLRLQLAKEKSKAKQIAKPQVKAAKVAQATPVVVAEPASSVGGPLQQATAVVTAAEINDRHGTGVLLARLFQDEPGYIHIRSRNLYGGASSGAQQILLPPGSDAEAEITPLLNGTTIHRILSVPYDRSDVANTLALQRQTSAPLCTWIMDHNLGEGPEQIPPRLMQELLRASTLRLGISPEICTLYQARFGLPLYFAPPVVDACLGQRDLLHLPPDSFLPPVGVLLGNVWSQQWLKCLAQTLATAKTSLVAFGHKSPQWVKHDALAAHVDMKGFLAEEDLVAALRAHPFAIVPTGTLDASDDLPEIAQYSLPSRTLNLSAVGNLPLIVLGHPDTGVARFVTRHGLGLVVPYDGKRLRQAVQQICQPEAQLRFRRRAAQLAPAFAYDGLMDWLWRSLDACTILDNPWSAENFTTTP